MSPYAYTWNDPVNYADPTGMIGERIGDPGGPSINKIYGPKGGKLIEEITLKGIKKPNIVNRFMQMSINLDKGFEKTKEIN
ncbi:hypothetical protein SD427_14145 [Chryseobacterium sp. JJR-5R]|uniref:hypothetical protein n=1 Tax=Chryseobacterium sp. JJR-5R TaxID=3093923 RepID=UPI002A760D7C|nr:hypothetical protein [Chryseobacterium sp. JJR-5R]WPO81901.1 hypothetical protein SD427_14145 [Chryseobacterium sp. JJR-5R]